MRATLVLVTRSPQVNIQLKRGGSPGCLIVNAGQGS